MKSYGAYQANSKQMDNTHLYEIQEKDPKKAYEQQKIINKVTTKINNTFIVTGKQIGRAHV